MPIPVDLQSVDIVVVKFQRSNFNVQKTKLIADLLLIRSHEAAQLLLSDQLPEVLLLRGKHYVELLLLWLLLRSQHLVQRSALRRHRLEVVSVPVGRAGLRGPDGLPAEFHAAEGRDLCG